MAVPQVITGRVRDHTGEPVPGARVFFASGPVPLPDVAALTGPDGVFRLTAPAPGEYSVMCTLASGDRRLARLLVPATTEVVLTFDPMSG